jgi:molybdopterin-guanine dinucleotide biosynthesis protein A
VKKVLLPASSLLMIAALVLVGGKSSGSEKITVMNPAITNTMVDRVPLTKRLASLEDKTIYMVDINWGGPDAAYSVFEEMQIWFSKNMPSVKTVLKRKSGSYSTDDPGLWKEISEKGDAAIIGISG